MSMSLPNTESNGSWSRDSGPLLEFEWLGKGCLQRDLPDEFRDTFLRTRDISAWRKRNAADFVAQSTLEENWCLHKLVEEVRPAQSLEIGVCRGSTSLVIADSCRDHGITCQHTALDIDPMAIEAVTNHFDREGFKPPVNAILADSRQWLPQQRGRWQFAFLDGDHSYEAVSFEFVEVWNRLDVGGCIALHDIGSIGLGTNHLLGPGQLFFYVLDRELGGHAEMGYIDASEQRLTLRLLRNHQLLYRQRANFAVIISGGFGLGIVRKLSEKKLDHESFRGIEFPPEPTYPPLPDPIIARALGRVRRLFITRPWDVPEERGASRIDG